MGLSQALYCVPRQFVEVCCKVREQYDQLTSEHVEALMVVHGIADITPVCLWYNDFELHDFMFKVCSKIGEQHVSCFHMWHSLEHILVYYLYHRDNNTPEYQQRKQQIDDVILQLEQIQKTHLSKHYMYEGAI